MQSANPLIRIKHGTYMHGGSFWISLISSKVIRPSSEKILDFLLMVCAGSPPYKMGAPPTTFESVESILFSSILQISFPLFIWRSRWSCPGHATLFFVYAPHATPSCFISDTLAVSDRSMLDSSHFLGNCSSATDLI